MCGRFVRYTPIFQAVKRFKAQEVYPFEPEPSYNIAPTQEVVIVNTEGVRQMLPCRWGFIPSWSKDVSIGSTMINARSETVAEKLTFRTALKKQRCLVIADGFYEWKKEGKRKLPVYIRLKSDETFGLAGLYNIWTSPAGDEVRTCTIITTRANELIQLFHDRMPVIIPEDKEDLWLDQGMEDKEMLQSVLQPYPADLIEAYAVSPKMNTPSHNEPENIEPI
jgi:putative SOS response-associated peptidase YedK